jgi:serine protease inhibitor
MKPMQIRKVYAAAAVLAAVAALAIAQSRPRVATVAMVYQQQQNANAKAASNSINQFGMKLTARVASEQQHQNVFISPLSIFTALIMTENGSAGSTRDAMRKALAVPADLSEDALHQSASALLKSLQAQKGVELAIANALWSDTRWPLAQSFIQQCHDLFQADATTLNFSQPSAANTINAWVKKNTRGKIDSIVDAAALRESAALLTNAVYFKGKWQLPFPKDKTEAAPFHLANGQTKNVPLMHLSSIKDAYRSGDGFEAAALAYEGSSTIMFYALLPAQGKSPEQVLENLQVEKLRSSSSGATELDLSLPRFTLDFHALLKDPLAQMGMSRAFQPGADFQPMGSPNFFIGNVIHKSRLEVDEEGTVATAVTGVTMTASAVMRREHKVLTFDRPFAVLLCDTSTGAILFAGVIYDPQ